MNYTEFRGKFQNQPLIGQRDLSLIKEDKQALSNQLLRWKNQNLLIQLKRGWYLLNSKDSKTIIELPYIANKIYEPSYVSLEFALYWYDLIPERVGSVTSVTTKKTTTFTSKTGNFIYQHIKPKTFAGFKKIGKPPFDFFMAEPEKAVLDFLYLNLEKFNKNVQTMLEESYRFQNMDSLNPQRINELAETFQCKKLIKVTESVLTMIEKEKN